ncbi:hypothetical protein BEWA_007310 [Theileria equi strain WA]|uniref:Signal peptide-containing protein n=1 Tax=Theileria equi strain WA TaxID=1537102 RepID=L0B0E0_THEEQ|nr:hypothetical protein BEWA_007310 [Theileria equi strain WA]AFZ81322.1 hypothetical protein BEWA_007310 [Theileria equi strain WA]|eukprot:XP_004830988.1 hypothetical protein BEWA_007310 [Theileria equi strain WA]
MNGYLIVKFLGIVFSLSFVDCRLETFQNDCVNYCNSLHPRKGAQYPSGNPTESARYSSEDVALAACKQRCRMSEIIRPKSEIEIFGI